MGGGGGSLHEKTCTGASFILGYYVLLLTFTCLYVFCRSLTNTKMSSWINKSYACATRSSLTADRFHTETRSFHVYMTLLRNFVSEWNSLSGTTTGVNSRRSDSRRHDINFVVVSCKQIQSHER